MKFLNTQFDLNANADIDNKGIITFSSISSTKEFSYCKDRLYENK